MIEISYDTLSNCLFLLLYHCAAKCFCIYVYHISKNRLPHLLAFPAPRIWTCVCAAPRLTVIESLGFNSEWHPRAFTLTKSTGWLASAKVSKTTGTGWRQCRSTLWSYIPFNFHLKILSQFLLSTCKYVRNYPSIYENCFFFRAFLCRVQISRVLLL